MWSHTTIICKRSESNLKFLPDIFWSLKKKFPSPVVPVHTKPLCRGGQGRPSFTILSFPAILLLENGIPNKP
jgi:hypothetical protein